MLNTTIATIVLSYAVIGFLFLFLVQTDLERQIDELKKRLNRLEWEQIKHQSEHRDNE